MAFGNRIRHFRNRIGLRQRELGELLGFKGRTADVRIAQYENEARAPKEELVKQMAAVFKVVPQAITVPDIDTYNGLMHTLFALEDMYGLVISDIDGEICLRLDRHHKSYLSIAPNFRSWCVQRKKFKDEQITKEEYDEWRYTYPMKDLLNSPS